LIALAGFCSGAASVTLEVVWSKALVVPLGNSSDATALVLAGFMLGIAAGGRLGATLARRATHALRYYFGLETLLSLFALVVPILLVHLTGLTVPTPWSSVSWTAFTVRLFAALCLIAVPCLVMGATLPLLLATPAATPRPRLFVGLLYGVNTLGATIAAIVTGFVGVGSWGISACSRRAALCSAIAALLAIGALAEQRRLKAAASAKSAPSDEAPAAAIGGSGLSDPSAVRAGTDQRRLALVATFVSGFVLLAAEVFWARILTFVFGHDTYAFATLLGVVLLGLAAGGLCYPLFSGRDPRRVVGWSMALTSLSLLASFYLSSWLLIRHGRDPFGLGERLLGSSTLSVEMLREITYTPTLVLLPCLCSGLGYPATIALHCASRTTASRSAGAVGFVNGIGATVGVSVTAIGLVSSVGIQGVLSLIVLAAAVTATWLLDADPTPRRARWLHLLPVGAMAAWLAVGPSNLPERMLRSVVGPRHQTLLYYEEARTATVSVIRNQIHGERQLLVNAVNEVTTRLVHDQSFKLLGHLGPLLHPDPHQAVMICLGAGLAAGSALTHPLERLDVVDLLGAVRHGAGYFAEENQHVLQNPRLALHVNDGRQFLLTTDRRYDVAIVDSTHPKSVDSWILYTREFFQLLRSRLNPGGIVVQWLPLHGLSEREFFAVVATFASVFPQMTLWASVGYETYGQVGYAKLVGQQSDTPMRFDTARMTARLSSPAVQNDLVRYGMGTLTELLDQFVAGPNRIGQVVKGYPLLTDDRPFLAYLTPLSAGRAMVPERLLVVREPVRPFLLRPEAIDPLLLSQIEHAFDAQGLVISGQLESAAAYQPTGEKIRRYVEQTKTTLPYYSAIAARYPDDAERLFEAGTQLGFQGHFEAAEAVIATGLRHRPDSLRLGLNAGLLWLGSGNPHRAAEVFSKMLARRPRSSLLNQNLGAALLAEGEPGAARRALLTALSEDPHSVGARLALADAEIALGNWPSARSLLMELLRDEPYLETSIERLAIVVEQLGDPGQATELFARASRINPYQKDFALRWGKRLIESHPDQALTVLSRTAELHSESAAVRAALGDTWLRLEQWQNASEQFVSALERDPDQGAAALGLGRALARLGRKGEARDALCLALRLTALRGQVLAELQAIGEKLEHCSVK
jgi:spermidine synthase